MAKRWKEVEIWYNNPISSGEIYPNAPLSLVIAEVRYLELQEWGPKTHNSTLHAILMGFGSNWVLKQESSPASEADSEQTAFGISRDRTWIVTMEQNRLTLQTTNYQGFAEFQAFLIEALGALEQAFCPGGVIRIGLRYINEISVPEEPPDWSNWLSDWLLPKGSSDLHPLTWLGSVQYGLEAERHLVLKYGPPPGPVMSPDEPLQVIRSYPGPIFLLDFDSFWQPAGIPPFSHESIKDQTSRLHKPIGDLFESLITENSREYFRNKHS